MTSDTDQLEHFTWQHPYFKTLTPYGKLAFIYLLDLLLKNRDYVSTSVMAKETGLSEDLCDTLIHKFAVDRQLPRVVILEEQIG